MTENPSSQSTQNADLGDELRELGRQLQTAVQSVLSSEQAKTIQNNIASGVREISSQIQVAVQNVKNDPRVQEATEKGVQTVNQIRETPPIKDLQDVLARGVSELNTQLKDFIQKMESQAPASSSTPAATQVPIEHSEASTGETTKL